MIRRTPLQRLSAPRATLARIPSALATTVRAGRWAYCLALGLALACGGEEERAPAGAASPPAAPAAAVRAQAEVEAASTTPDDLPRGLLLSLSPFEVSPEGKVLPKPTAARLEILTREGGAWKVRAITDPDSNVFHKAIAFDGGILTLGGTAAALKLWRPDASGTDFTAETLWTKDFGGRFSRMRDAEVADLDGDGRPDLAVATHDQGVVAIVKQGAGGAWEVEEIDHEKDTFVHEIEVGDLDGDGVVEVYATPSEPNRLDGTPQPGKVTRYVPAKGEGRVVVADLGDRHAKEILVADVDGDGRDELYVAVEAVSGGRVEIRRYDAETPPTGGAVVAELDDTQTRFLTAGDVDGDGGREMVAAGMKSGLWLLRPGPAPATAPWTKSQIDARSGGFEHASTLADLDGDGRDELYVASDNQGEVRRYVWRDGSWAREVIHTRKPAGSAFTWNLNPIPR
jgi:hypothetical protein